MAKNPILLSRHAIGSSPNVPPLRSSAPRATLSALNKPAETSFTPDLGAYMPTFAELRKRSGLLDNALKHEAVTIPTALFRLLLGEVVRRQPFDEEDYLAANQDVAQAAKTGVVAPAYEHYAGHGYFEGRRPDPAAIDESWYLYSNPDVAEAVRKGLVESGAAHYEATNRREGRLGSVAAGIAKSAWDAALDKQ